MITVQERTMFSDSINKAEAVQTGASFQEELCDMLADVPLLDNLSGAELRLLIPYLLAHSFPAGATIVEKGWRDNQLGIVLKGKITTYAEDDTGARSPLKVVTPGMCFGEASLIDDLPYSCTIVAETEATLVFLSREDFRKIAATHSVIGVRLLHKICRLLNQQLRQDRGPLVEYLR